MRPREKRNTYAIITCSRIVVVVVAFVVVEMIEMIMLVEIINYKRFIKELSRRRSYFSRRATSRLRNRPRSAA